jgi:tetratricopeptide (TPR) repeat protein
LQREELQQIAKQIDDLFDLGKIEEGQELLVKALEMSASDEAYLCYFKAEAAGYIDGNFDEHANLLKKASELSPEDIFLLRGLGVCQLMSDKVWQAVRTFDKLLAMCPTDYDTLRCMGITHSRLDRDRKALKFYAEALAINPKDSDSMRQTGVSLSKLGEDREAIDWFRRTLQINEFDYDAMRQMGISLAMLEDLQGAREWLLMAQAINPKDYETRLNLALVNKKLRGEETWLEKMTIKLGRWMNRIWCKLLDRFGLR